MSTTPERSPSEADAAARFEGVHMIFPRLLGRPVEALRGFDLVVPTGSVVGLLGPNGSGKTTAISCLLGLLQPQRGGVMLWGRAVEGGIARRDGRRVGVLLEDTRLPPFLTVRAALTTVCRVRGMSARAAREDLSRVTETTRCAPLMDRQVSVLSKGQARRVGLTAALLGDPELLILDEPSAGLDVSAREEFNDLVRRLRDGRRTVLIASHFLSDIESTCTHVAIVQEGRVSLFQTAERMLREARAQHDEKDVYVDLRFAGTLQELGVGTSPSKYPGLVLVTPEGSEQELMLRLARAGVVPSRIEPRVNLLSLYLDVVGRESD